MLKTVFTLDYEIHGNGDGCPYELMVEPTQRLLDQFNHYGGKLTIMADVAEILKFKEYKEQFGRDDYYYDAIAGQLRDAIRCGHDVQLHMHASYFNARHEKGRWLQDWSEYNFATLRPERMLQLLAQGKQFLEDLLRPVNSSYRCFVFRAGNWAMTPSQYVVPALVNSGFAIDTSVFKYGRRSGLVSFDYSGAHSHQFPWRVCDDDICKWDPRGRLFEFPIYSERRSISDFLSLQRFYRVWQGSFHGLKVKGGDGVVSRRPPQPPISVNRASFLRRKHALKADFNQCTGRQLIGALERAMAGCANSTVNLPFVLIGHSKLFTRFNKWALRPFLAYVAQRSNGVGFGTFGEFDLKALDAKSPSPLRSDYA